MRTILKAINVALALATALGCQSAITSIGAANTPSQLSENIVWPKPPAAARIRYLRTVSVGADLGIQRSFLGKIADVVTGTPQARFVRPTGVAQSAGVMYVADPGAQAVWVFDTDKQQTVAIRRAGDSALASPVAVAPASDGGVFVGDSVLGRIFLFDREGKLLREMSEGLTRPVALAYSAGADRLYVADSAAQQIVVYSGAGKRILSWGRRGSGDGEFNFPAYLALSGTSVVVTDALNYRVQAFDPDGKFLWKFGRQGDGAGDFAAPKGIASDAEGHLYVVDGLFDAIQIFGHDGALLLAFGDHGAMPGEFSLPTGAFVDPGNRIYVADSYNHRVQVFEFVGAPSAQDAAQTATR